MAVPTEFERVRKRRNIALLLVLGAAALIVGLIPGMCASGNQPEVYAPTMSQVPANAAVRLPAWVPATAREVHARTDRSSGGRWVRFAFNPADTERMTAGMRPLTAPETQALVPTGPGFSPWWTLNERTMMGSQGKKLRGWEVGAPDAGYLVVDPRTSSAFFWTVAR